MHCQSPVGASGNSGKCSWFGGNQAEFFPQDTVLSSARWTSLYRFLYWSFHPATIRSEYTSRVKGEQKAFLCRKPRILDQVGPYFFIVTMEITTFMSIERWLHMSQRSLITNGRVYKMLGVFFILPILCLPFGIFRNILVFVFGIMCRDYVFRANFSCLLQSVQNCSPTSTAGSSEPTSYRRSKVYRKSVFTIFFILLLFLVSYVPNSSCLAVLSLFASKLKPLYVVVLYVPATVLFSSSSLNPILYCWRLRNFVAL